MEGSGNNDAWIGAGLCEPTTMQQIIEDKHMKRALDAHLFTMEPLGDILIEEYDTSAIDDFRGIITMTENACLLQSQASKQEAHHSVVYGMPGVAVTDEWN